MYLKLIAAALVSCLGTGAVADLSFCNETDLRAQVAIGYIENDVWTSEGWWEVLPTKCTVVRRGNLTNKYVYWRGLNEHGIFAEGKAGFCVSRQPFTIPGNENCEDRGFDTAAFKEVDTGDSVKFTISLTSVDAPRPGGAAAPQPPGKAAPPVSSGPPVTPVKPLAGGAPPAKPVPQGGLAAQVPALAQMRLDQVITSLQGAWQDQREPNFSTHIVGTRLTDKFRDADGPAANWRLAPSCPGSNGKGPVMVVTYDGSPNEPLCWVLLELDAHVWRFQAIGGTGPSEMRRK